MARLAIWATVAMASCGAPAAGSGGGPLVLTTTKQTALNRGKTEGWPWRWRRHQGQRLGWCGSRAHSRNSTQRTPCSGGDGSEYGGGGSQGSGAGGGAVRIIWGIKFSYPDNADIEAVERSISSYQSPLV